MKLLRTAFLLTALLLSQVGYGQVLISNLPPANLPLTGAEIFPCTQALATKKCTITNIVASFYPLTSAEVAAGVTPVNFGFSVGNVLRYGADPTGVLDSTTAVANTFAVLAHPPGGTVYFPTGIYKVTAVTISGAATVKGDGIGATQIFAGDATSDVFTITGSSVSFQDFTINASVTRTNGRYFYAKSTSSIVTFQNVYMLGWFYGIDLEGSNYTIRDSLAVNGVASSGTAVRIGLDATVGSLSNISIINLKVNNPPGARPFACIAVGAAGDISLIDDELQFCGIGLDVVPSGTSVVASLYSVNTFFDNAGSYGVFMQPQASGAAIVRTRFIGPWASSAGTNGMFFDTSAHAGTIDGVDVIGAHVLLNGAQGINLAGTGTKRVKILGSEIAGSVGAGVLISSAVSFVQVQDNTIGPTGAVGGNSTFGIVLQAGAGNEFVITSNDLCGNTSGGLSDASTGTSKNISGNLCYNPVGSTSIANTSTSPVTFTNTTGAPVYVSVTGTPTITTITMGGLQIGNATGTAYVVPVGQTITINFSAGTANVTYWGVN